MTPLVDLVCAWLGFVLVLVACCCVVWAWERVTGRAFDPLMGMEEQAREIRELPELEPRRWIA